MAKLHSAPRHFLMQLYPNYTQKHVITYTNRFLQVLDYTDAKFERLEALCKGRARCLKVDT